MSIKIIAEAGVNHNGDYKLAEKLVDKAVWAGADCVKFQTFVAKNAVSASAPQAEYQRENTQKVESQYEMVKRLELPFEDFRTLSEYCTRRGITFCSTAFDLDSIQFLRELQLPFWKIPSGEITNLPYLIQVAQVGSPIILSTGMCHLKEVETAVCVLQKYGARDITLLHCTTQYPTPFAEVNLNAMLTLKQKFGLPVGYSDHTKGIEVPIAAAALGAEVIEKHFTLDRTLPGPDHKASLEPDELKKMVEAIRGVELALGSGRKEPAECELANLAVARKSIVANTFIPKGTVFTQENITVKRPGTGISPMRWFEVLGQRAVRDFSEDEMIEL